MQIRVFMDEKMYRIFKYIFKYIFKLLDIEIAFELWPDSYSNVQTLTLIISVIRRN
jgi:hypothetical protein